MDIERRRRRQNLKLIISESVMLGAVVAIVTVLALAVSGYWINSDFEVERQGMLQISSYPSGADLVVDGESSWFQRTNTSKILSSGEHTIELTRDGYDSWSRTINISEGLLYRIHYPRLFLTERTSEVAFDASGFTKATVSPNNKYLLLMNDTTEWSLINLDTDTLKPEKISIAPYFSDVSVATGAPVGIFAGKVINYDWDGNSEHVLFKIENKTGTEWVILDVKNPKDSLNLTREFGVKFDEVKIFNNSASALLVLENGILRKIDARNKTISANLAKNIVDFDYYDDEVVFVTKDETESYHVGLMRVGGEEVETLETLETAANAAIMQFYDEKYIALLSGQILTLHEKEDYEKFNSYELNFAPDNLKVGHRGEFITMRSGNSIATFDMEDKSLRTWEIEGSNFGWLDNDMIYAVKGGELIVYDFDGLNRRVLAKNVSGHFPVTITNNKWLYYFSDGDLVREVVAR